MKKSSKVASLVVIVLACVLSLVAAGCGSDFGGDESAPAEKTGTLSTALSTTGTDGATYTFVPGSLMSLQLMGGSFFSAYPMDGAETVFTRTLGVGNYQLFLSFGAYGGTPALVRTKDSISTTVLVQWTDTQPVTFPITADTTTNVTLNFVVPGLANVSFTTGTVSVTANVTQGASETPKYVTEYANVTVQSVSFADPTAAYATELAETQGTLRYQAVGVQTTGAWTLEGDKACVPVVQVSFGTDGNDHSFNRRLVQLSGATGTACIQDFGTNDVATVTLERIGAAPAAQTSYLPGSNYRFYLTVSMRVGDVFDGITLNQAALQPGVAVTEGTFFHSITDWGPPSASMTSISGTMSAPAQFKLEP
jgi:hypothetical protein